MLEQIAVCLHTLSIPVNGSFIVGVSGGADSMVLLYILRKLGYKCLAVHCNFLLRDEESERDENAVRAFCKAQEIDLHVERFETSRIAAAQKISIELAARDLRYSLFEKLRLERGYDYIAVAHHRDDQIETVFMNMLRGCGIRGVAGMKPKNGVIVRPFLTVSREDIESFAEKHMIYFVTDSTNEKTIYKRNKVRLQLLPLLEEIHPGFRETLNRTITNLQDAEEYYHEGVYNAKKRVLLSDKQVNDHLFIDIESLKKEQSPRTLLFEILSPLGFNLNTIESILQSLDSDSGLKFYSSTHRIVKDRNTLQIDLIQIKSDDVYYIDHNQTELLSPVHLSFETIADIPDEVIEKSKQIAMFDLEKLQFPLVLRHWKQGDRMVPLGMKGRKKISDIFTNLKYSLYQKEDAWLLCSGDNIIWLVGERLDDRYKINGSTKRIYKIILEQNKHICTK